MMGSAGGTLRFGRPKAYEMAQAQAQASGLMGSQAASGGGGGAAAKPQQLLEAPPTAALRMTNMLTDEIVRDDEEYSDVKEDIEDELKECAALRCVAAASLLLPCPLSLSHSLSPLHPGLPAWGITSPPCDHPPLLCRYDVQSVEIPRSGAGFLCVFAKFGAVEQATRAKEVLAGRTFGGKQVGAEYFPTDRFDAKQFGLV
jgi:hypothetical protein